MAHIVESVAVIKISSLVKDGETIAEQVNDDFISQLEAVLEELVGDPKAMIEVIRAE